MLDVAPSDRATRFAFQKNDEVRINGIAYRPFDRSENAWVFAPLQEGGVAECWSDAELSRLVARGLVEHRRDALAPTTVMRRSRAPAELLSCLSPAQQERAMYREALVRAFLAMEAAGKVQRTDHSIASRLSDIKLEAGRILSAGQAAGGKVDPRLMVVPQKVGARSLRRWVKAFEDLGMSGLYDRVGARGNRERRLRTRELELLGEAVRGYLSDQRPSQAVIHRNVRCAFAAENKKRLELGMAPLTTPSRETVRREIRALDPFHVDVARHGLEVARAKRLPVGGGLDLTRPLERVEMDEWKVDLAALMASGGALQFVSEEDKARLGLDGSKGRWWLTVAICATTRCVLAMKLSRDPSARSAIQTLDMIMHDKGRWTDAVGA